MNRESKLFNQVSLATGKSALVAAVYYAFSLGSLLFISTENSLPLVWPQAGFSIAAIMLAGFEALPGVLIGSFLIAVSTGVAPELAAIVALGNTIAAFIPAYFLLTRNNFSTLLDNISSILKLFILGVIISPMISASISLLGINLVSIPVGEEFPVLWGTRWLRDALGVLICTPFLIVWLGNALPRFDKHRLIDGALIFLAGVSMEVLIFFGRLPPQIANAVTFFLIPIVIWASIRLNIHGLVLANLVISGFFLWGTAKRMGPLFGGDVPADPTFLCVLVTMWATSLILSASISKYNKAQKSLSDLSNHDPLTGLFNRLFFETELKRLDNSRQFPISLIMADVDNLKEINDTFGHRSGDQLLKNLAMVLTSVLRHEDIVCRIGGDEFVALLPSTGVQESQIIIERLNKFIETYNHDHPNLPIRISMGVSTANQGEALLGHLKIADNLMYEEKNRKKTGEPLSFFIPTERREK